MFFLLFRRSTLQKKRTGSGVKVSNVKHLESGSTGKYFTLFVLLLLRSMEQVYLSDSVVIRKQESREAFLFCVWD